LHSFTPLGEIPKNSSFFHPDVFDASQGVATKFAGYFHIGNCEIFSNSASTADVLASPAAVDLHQRHLQPTLFASVG
jgi:hypothetical protein